MAHLESFTPAKNQVPHRNTNVVIDNLAMTFRSIVVTKDLHRPNHLYTWSVRRNNDDALLAVPVRVVGIALSEDEMYGTAWVSGAANPPKKE